ncbi:MAG: hypothetical protein HRF51_13360, partial [bacterium]
MNSATRTVPLKWVVAQEPDPELLQEISNKTGLDRIIAKILFNRQIDTPETIRQFLQPSLKDLQDPFTLYGMDRAVD